MKTEDENTPKKTEHEPRRAEVSDVSELPEPEQERIARRHAAGRATAFGFPPHAGENYRRYYRRGIGRR
jgi:hypothetical protein